MASSVGLKTAKSAENGCIYVTKINVGDYIKVRSIDFGKGAKSFEVNIASASNGGAIEIHIDKSDGSLIGTCSVKNTGGWQNWAIQSSKVNKVDGVHDVYFVFKGGEGDLFNFDWWKFNK